MNSIPKEEIKTGLYKYVSKISNIYLFNIFKKTNYFISFHYTYYPIPKIWKTLYEIDINNYYGTFYKANTLVK